MPTLYAKFEFLTATLFVGLEQLLYNHCPAATRVRL